MLPIRQFFSFFNYALNNIENDAVILITKYPGRVAVFDAGFLVKK